MKNDECEMMKTVNGSKGKAPRSRPDWSDRLILAALTVVVSWSYVATLLPGPGYSGDVCKLQFVGWALGTPHATGYPVWMLASYLFTHLVPLGTIAWRANLLSAVFATGAVAVLFLLLRRGIKLPLAAAAGTALVFAFSSTWWSQAVIAEVYTLHGLCVAAGIGLLLRWQVTRRDRWLAAATTVLGISLANHMTTLVVLPAFVAFVLMVDHRVLVGRRGVVVLPAVLLPILLYLYPFWRTLSAGTTYLEMQTPDLETFFWYMSGAQFRDRMFAFGITELFTSRLAMGGRLLLDQFGWVGIGLAAAGAATLRDVQRHVLLAGTLAGTAGYALCYDIPDIEVYFIPCWLVVTIYIGVAAASARDRFGRVGAVVAALVAMTLAGVLWAQNKPRVDLSGHTADVEWAQHLIGALPPKSVIISSEYKDYELLQYYRQTQQTQGRVFYVVSPALAPEMRAHIDKLVLELQPPPLVRSQAERAHGPGEVREYLLGNGELTNFEERLVVPPGLPVLVAGEVQRQLLESFGLVTEPVETGLWRVTLE